MYNQNAPKKGQELSLPAELWCPNCQIHSRHQDGYNTDQHILRPLCPICQDIKDKENNKQLGGQEA